MFGHTKKIDYELEAAFKEETRERIARETRRGVLATFFMYPVFIPLDYLVYPDLAPTFMWIRLTVVALSIGVHFLMRLPFPEKHARLFGIFSYLYCTLAIVLMVHLVDGYASPYYAGINLVLICLLFILPMNVKETAFVMAVVYAAYIVPILLKGGIVDTPAFAGNNFFLISTMLLAILSSYMATSMRRKEFTSRYELARANEELKKLDVVKSQFFASISHEIRTPLTSIMAPTDSLRRGDVGLLSTSQQSLIDQVHRNALRLLDLINQMLDFAKFDAGKMTIRLKRVDVIRLIRNQVTLFREVCIRKGLTLEYEVSQEIPIVFLDQEKLDRIVSNLIRNAIKFTEEGGITIKISAEETPAPGWITIQVLDTGIGIAADNLEKIFNHFQQVDGSTTRRYEGTGLGLAIVRESVELQHGRTSVNSEVDKGSRFTVQLPMNLDELEPEAEIDRRAVDRRREEQSFDGKERRKAPRRDEDGKITISDLAMLETELVPDEDVVIEEFPQSRPSTGIRVLYVEDNSDLRLYISRMLGSFGHSVSLAVNGLDGWQKTQEILPDIIVSDVMMPGMNGLNLAQLVKATGTTQKIPIILITAKSEIDSRIEGLEIGADDYLGKPINIRELDARIRNIVSERRFRDALSKAEETEERINQLAIGFSRSLELRDGYTGGHSEDVLNFGTIIIKELGIPMDQTLRLSLLMHDIGKIGIPDSILRKPAPLTSQEWKIMRKHPEMGAELLSQFDSLSDMGLIILSHHERYDGTGYPQGLSGEDIPLAARIIAIADAWHAMREDRTYRKAIPLEDAVNELISNRGRQFDPVIVDRFLCGLVREGIVPEKMISKTLI